MVFSLFPCSWNISVIFCFNYVGFVCLSVYAGLFDEQVRAYTNDANDCDWGKYHCKLVSYVTLLVTNK